MYAPLHDDGSTRAHVLTDAGTSVFVSFRSAYYRAYPALKVTTLGGYNLRSFQLRNDITRAISAVRKPGRTYNSLIDEYV